MTIRFNTIAKAALTAAIVATAGAANAFSFDICKDVKIDITNDHSEAVQVYDIDFYDYGSEIWRSEPTVNKVMPTGSDMTLERNLENVKNAYTRIRVQYKMLQAGRWKIKSYDKSAKFTCTKGTRIAVHLN